jgi:hypothetical protein
MGGALTGGCCGVSVRAGLGVSENRGAGESSGGSSLRALAKQSSAGDASR